MIPSYVPNPVFVYMVRSGFQNCNAKSHRFLYTKIIHEAHGSQQPTANTALGVLLTKTKTMSCKETKPTFGNMIKFRQQPDIPPCTNPAAKCLVAFYASCFKSKLSLHPYLHAPSSSILSSGANTPICILAHSFCHCKRFLDSLLLTDDKTGKLPQTFRRINPLSPSILRSSHKAPGMLHAGLSQRPS